MIEARWNRYALIQLAVVFALAWAQPALAAPPVVPGAVGTVETPVRSEQRSRASVVPALVFGGAGVAALASGFLLAHWARNDEARLDQCAPNCKQYRVDHVSDLYLAADITLGVGVVGLGAATWFYFAREGSAEPVAPSSPRVDVTPTARGAKATLRGVF